MSDSKFQETLRTSPTYLNYQQFAFVYKQLCQADQDYSDHSVTQFFQELSQQFEGQLKVQKEALGYCYKDKLLAKDQGKQIVFSKGQLQIMKVFEESLRSKKFDREQLYNYIDWQLLNLLLEKGSFLGYSDFLYFFDRLKTKGSSQQEIIKQMQTFKSVPLKAYDFQQFSGLELLQHLQAFSTQEQTSRILYKLQEMVRRWVQLESQEEEKMNLLKQLQTEVRQAKFELKAVSQQNYGLKEDIRNYKEQLQRSQIEEFNLNQKLLQKTQKFNKYESKDYEDQQALNKVQQQMEKLKLEKLKMTQSAKSQIMQMSQKNKQLAEKNMTLNSQLLISSSKLKQLILINEELRLKKDSVKENQFQQDDFLHLKNDLNRMSKSFHFISQNEMNPEDEIALLKIQIEELKSQLSERVEQRVKKQVNFSKETLREVKLDWSIQQFRYLQHAFVQTQACTNHIEIQTSPPELINYLSLQTQTQTHSASLHKGLQITILPRRSALIKDVQMQTDPPQSNAQFSHIQTQTQSAHNRSFSFQINERLQPNCIQITSQVQNSVQSSVQKISSAQKRSFRLTESSSPELKAEVKPKTIRQEYVQTQQQAREEIKSNPIVRVSIGLQTDENMQEIIIQHKDQFQCQQTQLVELRHVIQPVRRDKDKDLGILNKLKANEYKHIIKNVHAQFNPQGQRRLNLMNWVRLQSFKQWQFDFCGVITNRQFKSFMEDERKEFGVQTKKIFFSCQAFYIQTKKSLRMAFSVNYLYLFNQKALVKKINIDRLVTLLIHQFRWDILCLQFLEQSLYLQLTKIKALTVFLKEVFYFKTKRKLKIATGQFRLGREIFFWNELNHQKYLERNVLGFFEVIMDKKNYKLLVFSEAFLLTSQKKYFVYPILPWIQLKPDFKSAQSSLVIEFNDEKNCQLKLQLVSRAQSNELRQCLRNAKIKNTERMARKFQQLKKMSSQ